jgi:hypothetical protein
LIFVRYELKSRRRLNEVPRRAILRHEGQPDPIERTANQQL